MPDVDRPLSRRGRKAARRMGQEFTRRGWEPELVLCSTATRTRETLDRLTAACKEAGGDAPPEIHYESELYLATAGVWLDHIHTIADDIGSVLAIGHNPGLHELATTLARKDHSDRTRKLERKFPTCALAVIRLDAASWSDIGLHRGHLDHLVFPRELD